MIKQSSLLIKLGVLSLAALFSVQASAALGKMRVLSRLGEPLHAEISLTGATGKEPNALRVGVAANGVFKELVISSQTQSGNISLNVIRRGKGRVLVVKSTGAVNEPVFRFAIEALTSNGSVIREYTVTLDPPQYRHSSFYHRYQGSSDAVLSSANSGLVKTALPSTAQGWRLFSVNDTSRPAAAAAPAAIPEASAGAATAIDMELAQLETRVKSRDEAIKANNEKLAELEKKLDALKHQMNQPGRGQQNTQPQPDGNNSPGIVDMLMDNLMYIGAALGALLVVALVLIKIRSRRKGDNNSPALTLNVGAPFAAGAQQAPKQPDTPKPMAFNQNAQQRQQASAQATFMTDFTQMSGAIDTGEVDPIAEAEVYIAYGRDAQAEEILLDALKQDPSRHEVRMKLMELYASKSDAPHFEKLAQEMHDAFDGRGALWAKAAAMGLALDPTNSLYQMSEAPSTRPAPTPTISVADSASGLISLDEELAAADLSAQLDDDVPIEEFVAPAVVADKSDDDDDGLLSALFSDVSDPTNTGSVHSEDAIVDLADDDGQQLNFSLDSLLSMSNPAGTQGTLAEAADEAEKDALLEFNLNEMIEPEKKTSSEQKPKEAELPTFAADFIEFDLSEHGSKEQAGGSGKTAAVAAVGDDPLSTKLDLAQVYLDMGDEEGAKEVLQELLAEADGSLREEALGMLARIGAQ